MARDREREVKMKKKFPRIPEKRESRWSLRGATSISDGIFCSDPGPKVQEITQEFTIQDQFVCCFLLLGRNP